MTERKPLEEWETPAGNRVRLWSGDGWLARTGQGDHATLGVGSGEEESDAIETGYREGSGTVAAFGRGEFGDAATDPDPDGRTVSGA
jgi:hypothetical protein